MPDGAPQPGVVEQKNARAARARFVGGTVVFAGEARPATLTVDDGVIAAIDDDSAAPAIDCTDCFLLPGLVDPHTDNLERHAEPRPGIFWPIERAVLAHDAELAASGITTAFNALTVGGTLGDSPRLKLPASATAAIEQARTLNLLRVDHRLHLRCELSDAALPRLLDDLAGTRPEIVSLMNHTPGRRQWRNLARFRAHYVQRYGLSHTDLEALILLRQTRESVVVPPNNDLVTAFARRHGARLASHDDTEIADVDESAALGCTFAEFPTTMDAAHRATERQLAVIAGAPNLARGRSHSGNVAAADLVRANCLHILSSDYCPASLLQSVFLLRDIFGWPLAAAVQSVTLTPARLLGLADRGEIAVGRRADILVVRSTPMGPVLRETWSGGVRVF